MRFLEIWVEDEFRWDILYRNGPLITETQANKVEVRNLIKQRTWSLLENYE